MIITIKELGMRYPKENSIYKRAYVLTKCLECGNKKERLKQSMHDDIMCDICDIPNRNRKNSKNKITHGSSKTRLYKCWLSMGRRCYAPIDKSYKYYGLVGVTVCNEWNESFEKFKEWSLANGYEDNLVLDKDLLCDALNIYPKIYSPKTCKWITQKDNLTYRHKGKKHDN